MALLAVVPAPCLRRLVARAQIDSYIAGLILLLAAPCTAMVFVWSNLCRGDANFTLSQVALNDAIMVVAYAPVVALLLASAITVPWIPCCCPLASHRGAGAAGCVAAALDPDA